MCTVKWILSIKAILTVHSHSKLEHETILQEFWTISRLVQMLRMLMARISGHSHVPRVEQCYPSLNWQDSHLFLEWLIKTRTVYLFCCMQQPYSHHPLQQRTISVHSKVLQPVLHKPFCKLWHRPVEVNMVTLWHWKYLQVGITLSLSRVLVPVLRVGGMEKCVYITMLY